MYMNCFTLRFINKGSRITVVFIKDCSNLGIIPIDTFTKIRKSFKILLVFIKGPIKRLFSEGKITFKFNWFTIKFTHTLISTSYTSALAMLGNSYSIYLPSYFSINSCSFSKSVS